MNNPFFPINGKTWKPESSELNRLNAAQEDKDDTVIEPLRETAVYHVDEIENVIRELSEAYEQAQLLRDGFLAVADMFYEMLAFINATRIFAGEPPLMADDINRMVESNEILNQMTRDIRKASITSGLGLVTNFTDTQQHIKNTVFEVWCKRMQDKKKRPAIKEQLFKKSDFNKESAIEDVEFSSDD